MDKKGLAFSLAALVLASFSGQFPKKVNGIQKCLYRKKLQFSHILKVIILLMKLAWILGVNVSLQSPLA